MRFRTARRRRWQSNRKAVHGGVSTAESRQFAVLSNQVCARCHGDQCPSGVKHIHDQHRKNRRDHGELQRSGNVELQEHGRDRRRHCGGGIATSPTNSVLPDSQPRIVANRIPMMTAPLTLRADRAAMVTKPRMQTIGSKLHISPNPTNVAGLSTTMPPFLSAMKPRNSPMPAAMSRRISCRK